MLTSLTIEDFRGISKLEIPELGRVNLFVGPNGSGKTSVLGAAAWARSPAMAAGWAPYLASPGTTVADFEKVFRTLHRGGDLERPIRLTAARDGRVRQVHIRVEEPEPVANATSITYAEEGAARPGTLMVPSHGQHTVTSNMESDDRDAWWSGPWLDDDRQLFQAVSALYRRGRLQQAIEPLRRIEPRVERVDLVGSDLYVVLAGYLPLPIGVLGDGARRLFEFAVGVAYAESTVVIDEIENGFHWRSLAAVWELLRTATTTQVFATTHRDECVREACETFRAAGDDSLRVVRLDRRDGEHRATIYTADMALAAIEAGLEIRG